jgi:hypothetical protein
MLNLGPVPKMPYYVPKSELKKTNLKSETLLVPSIPDKGYATYII